LAGGFLLLFGSIHDLKGVRCCTPVENETAKTSFSAVVHENTFVFVAGADFPGGGLFLPSPRMTWSVQFQGMGATDSVGVDLYSPAVVGLDFTDYWERHEGWLLRTNLVSMDFAARMGVESIAFRENFFCVPACSHTAILTERVL
jgi:hypothetical protein